MWIGRPGRIPTRPQVSESQDDGNRRGWNQTHTNRAVAQHQEDGSSRRCMAAPEKNTFSMKFKTSEERKALCDAWCEHLSAGFTRESFPLCDPQTFRRYLKDFPEDFDTTKLRAADATQILQWERRLHRIADTNEGNATATIFGLKNIAGWRDKQEIDQTVKGTHEHKHEISSTDKLSDILKDYESSHG